MRQNGCASLGFGLLAGLGLLAATISAATAEVKTNWVDRWITNTLEVYVPATRFVTEYHTNVILRTHTNVVDVFSTNLVTAYRTNRVAVNLVRTNFVHAYNTNYKNLNLTNWTTVLVLKTNWVQQTVTNLAEVDLARTAPARADLVKAEVPVTAVASPPENPLTIEATRGKKQAPKNQADVCLNVRWANQDPAAVQVRQWKVQSDDGSILCFGQEAQFRRNLPFGNYKVDVKAQLEGNVPAVSVRGTLSVSPGEVHMLDQRTLAKR
ncbi:MAG TPA: hypothetical protein VJA21_33250 [Verrucomicrobiae bacterium]